MTFTNEDWIEVPLFVLDDDVMYHCVYHGNYCPNAYYEQEEVSEMLLDNNMECPYCLRDICDG